MNPMLKKVKVIYAMLKAAFIIHAQNTTQALTPWQPALKAVAEPLNVKCQTLSIKLNDV